MLIFGGETSDGALLNTIWRFDLGKSQKLDPTFLWRPYFKPFQFYLKEHEFVSSLSFGIFGLH